LAAGDVDGLDPIEIPVASVYDIAERERNRRQWAIDAHLSKTADGQAVVTHRKLVEMAEQQRRRLEREAENGGKLNLTELHKLASTIGNLNRGQPRPPVSQALEGSNRTPVPPKPKQEQSDFQQRLERAAREVPPLLAINAETQEATTHAEPHQAEEVPSPLLADLMKDKSPAGLQALEAHMRHKLGWADTVIQPS